MEFFGEARIPIVQNRPLIHELGVDVGYRFSIYSTDAETDTYKIGLEWAPTEDIRFRGGYNRAVRAPNIVELFTPQAVGLSGTTDPCAGDQPEATLEQCALTGVTPA